MGGVIVNGMHGVVISVTTFFSHGAKIRYFPRIPFLCQIKQFFLNNFFCIGPRVLEPSSAHPEVGVAERMQPAPSLYDIGKWFKKPYFRVLKEFYVNNFFLVCPRGSGPPLTPPGSGCGRSNGTIAESLRHREVIQILKLRVPKTRIPCRLGYGEFRRGVACHQVLNPPRAIKV